MNEALLDKDVQQYLHQQDAADVNRIALGKSPFAHVSSRELAEQTDSRARCEKKLPLWFTNTGIIYPPKLSIEQSSSETTAQYKAQLIDGGTLIDLTGGFGVDSYYFAKKADQVTHCEINTELSSIAAHNAKALQANNINFINGNGIEYLQASKQVFNTIYIDPSRRNTAGRVFRLEDCEPDVITHLPLLLSKTKQLIIKTSPLLDISLGIASLKHVKAVHIISIKNDCKELLWIVEPNYQGEVTIVCTAFKNELAQTFQFGAQEEEQADYTCALPQAYIYEPDAAIMKAGAFKLCASRYGIHKLHVHSHLYTSDTMNEQFMGRVFQVQHVYEYKDLLKNRKIDQANIITRNFPEKPEHIAKKLKIKDGGDTYLLFTTDLNEQLKAIECLRIK